MRRVSRKAKDGSVFYPDQRMSRTGGAQVVHAGTARSRGSRKGSRGSLKPGKYADVMVLSKDILTIPEDEIPSAHVVYTIVGGKIR